MSEAGDTYQFPSLPSGEYVLTFELAGFQTARREAIELGVGQSLNVDIVLSIGALAETVQVPTKTIIDRQSNTIGNVLDNVALTTVPSSTDLWGALTLPPGIRAKGFDAAAATRFSPAATTRRQCCQSSIVNGRVVA